MRNLKKVLSLSLALVMLLGMMIVGAGAATFTDTAASEKKDAIDVMSGINVIQGSDGKFNPDGTLSRAEAAIIIARVYMTPELVAKLGAVECQFADVAPYPWASAAIQACANDNIIAGYDSTTFGPTDKVTEVQFAKMLLVTLGFDPARYTNNPNWLLNIRQDAIKAGLDANGVDISNNEMKREDAAQMALNGLVFSPKGDETTYLVTGVKTGDDATDDSKRVTLYDGSSKDVAYLNLTTAKSSDQFQPDTVKLTTITTNVDSLGQKNFGLTKTSTTDDLGRTAVRYAARAYKVDKLITEGADYTLKGAVLDATMYATVGEDIVKGYTWITKVDGVDIDTPNAKPIKNGFLSYFQSIGRGAVTEVYVHDDAKTVNVLVSNCYLGTVSKVTPAKGPVAAYVMVNGMKYETEGYEQGDVVIYTREDKTITSMQLAPEYTGTLTKIVNSTTFTIGGRDYVMSAKSTSGPSNSVLGRDITVYTDAQGNILAMKGAAATANEYIYVVAHSAAMNNPDYITSTTYPQSIEVYGVTNAGEIVKKNVVSIGSDHIGTAPQDNITANKDEDEDGVIDRAGLYKVTPVLGSDSITLTAMTNTQPKDDIAVNQPGVEHGAWTTGVTPSFTKAGDAVANSDTAFIFITQERKNNNDMTITNVTVKTGIANIGTNIAKAKATLAIDGKLVEAVFVTSEFVDGNSNAAGIVYLTFTEREIEAWEDGKKTEWYTYSGVDQAGDSITVTSKTRILGYPGKVFEYDEDNFLIGTTGLGSTRVFTKFVDSVKGSTIWLDSVTNSFNKVDSTDVVFLSGDGAGVAAGQQVTLVTASGDVNAKNHWDAQVVFVTDAGTDGSNEVRKAANQEANAGKTAANPIMMPALTTGKPITLSGLFAADATDSISYIKFEGMSKPIPVRFAGASNAAFDGTTGTVPFAWNDTNVNYQDVMAFYYKNTSTTASAANVTLTIKDANGTVKYQRNAGTKAAGENELFLVNVVNTRANTNATVDPVYNGDGSASPNLTTELPKGEYTWEITVGGLHSAGGRFEIAADGTIS